MTPPCGHPLQSLTDSLEASAAHGGEAVLAVPDGEERLVVLAADAGAVAVACETYKQQEADDSRRRHRPLRPYGADRGCGRVQTGRTVTVCRATTGSRAGGA